MINYFGIELYKTACDRDIPNVAMTTSSSIKVKPLRMATQ